MASISFQEYFVRLCSKASEKGLSTFTFVYGGDVYYTYIKEGNWTDPINSELVYL